MYMYFVSYPNLIPAEAVDDVIFIVEAVKEEHVTANTCNSKQAVSPVYTKNRTHLPTSSQFHDLRLHKCYPHSQQDVNAPSRQVLDRM